ncbi:toxin biosynthesis protein Tri7-like protein [Penicillium odoratum]|uniref:toxin biosynthesis protein Tri7-like protein n=1 Tax=Penicillium odoratum TaxID=1167516 RepID=UPI0025478648|nr:toxin biosynthesis protein Tri7-like protein [Penicillium odoratum]KAJ5746493.1 toxin biosynthesis protein Tri7-like protein [Penicillium odoratum]
MDLSPTLASWVVTNIQPMTTILLLCSTKKGHPLRWLNVFILIALTVIHGKYIHLLSMSTPDDVMQRISPLPVLLHTMVLFKGIDYQDLQAQHKPKDQGSRMANIWAAMRVTMDWSAVGTRWQVRNVPKMPAWLGSSPTLSRFLMRQVAVASWQYLMLDFLQRIIRENEIIWNEIIAVLLEPTITAKHSWLLEAAINIVTWFLIARLSLDFKWRATSIVAVGLGISEPANWPPMFGSSFEAYTIRNFWGKYWHQQLRWPLSATSSILTRNILHLPRPSILERYTSTFLSFLLSGLIHLAAQYKGSTFEKRGAVEFFTSFSLGIIIEDGAQALWSRITASASDENNTPNDSNTALWKKIIGYLWVTGWLVGLGAYYSYDMAYIALIEPMPLAVNFTALLTVPITVTVLVVGSLVGVLGLGAEP